MARFDSQLKDCPLCGQAFFGTFDTMACRRCEGEYRRLRENIRNYLWNYPGQQATLTSISHDLNIPLGIVKAFQKDPRFQAMPDDDDMADKRGAFVRELEERRRS